VTLATKQKKTTPPCDTVQAAHGGASNQSSEKPRHLHSSTSAAQAASWRALWDLLLSPEPRRCG
jgi:hypothetical protein